MLTSDFLWILGTSRTLKSVMYCFLELFFPCLKSAAAAAIKGNISAVRVVFQKVANPKLYHHEIAAVKSSLFILNKIINQFYKLELD